MLWCVFYEVDAAIRSTSTPLMLHFVSMCLAVFKWLSKVITRLRLLRLAIGLKDSRQFFNQWESKQKRIAPCTRDFSRASSELQIIAKNCDWFFALPAPVVIGRSNCFGFGFSTVIWKPLYSHRNGLRSKVSNFGSGKTPKNIPGLTAILQRPLPFLFVNFMYFFRFWIC